MNAGIDCLTHESVPTAFHVRFWMALFRSHPGRLRWHALVVRRNTKEGAKRGCYLGAMLRR